MDNLSFKIEKYFEKERENLLRDLSLLIEIPSVRGEANKDAPFGIEPKKALLKALEIAEGYGFATNNIDNYAGEIDLGGGEPTLAILGHLDVVPSGDGWTEEPFKMTYGDGVVYGRGVSDDKGPVIAALYALRAVKELNIPLKNAVRLIVGTAEETGSEDIAYYQTKRKMPQMTFTPDSSFPVTNIEKGRFTKTFTAFFSSDEKRSVTYFDGGTVANAVPSKATAVVKGFSKNEILSALNCGQSRTGLEFTVEEIAENESVIRVNGVGAHASTPQLGNNPVTALIYVLSLLENGDESCEIFKKLAVLFPYGKFHGEGLGVNMSDEISGELTLTLDILRLENGVVSGTFDSRLPICATKENLAFKVRDMLSEVGFTLSDTDMIPVHYVDSNSGFVSKLIDAYEEFTGNKGYCEAIGGGTYVHDIEGGVAFGAVMPGVNTNMHGDDEYMPIDGLIKAAEIFTKAIINICG